jgi:hypothetical protein
MPSIQVAGHTIRNPTQSIRDYLSAHERTIKDFDLVAGSSPGVLTPELVTASRVLSSRITMAEQRWLVEVQVGAPWELVSLADRFTDADASQVGGLYDRANVLWSYFWEDRPKGFATAKLSKILFLMRPKCYPIVDSHITRRYRSQVKTLKPVVFAARPELVGKDNLTWEAYRLDLVGATPALAAVREGLRKGTPLERSIANYVSDLRLFDMLAW